MSIKLVTILFGLIASFYSFDLYSQSTQYFQGYIITNANDTLEGYIRDDTRWKIAQRVFFKEHHSSIERSFQPDEIRAFYYEPSLYYESILAKEDGEPIRVFVKKLVTGYVDLYQFVSFNHTDYIFIKATDEQLQITKQDQLEDNKLKRDRRYIGQLRNFFRDCSNIALSNQEISYKEAAFIKLIEQYTSCLAISDDIRVLYEKKKIKLKIGPSVGMTAYDMLVVSFQDLVFPAEHDKLIVNYGFMLSVNHTGRFGVQSGLFYQHYDAVDQVDNFFGYIENRTSIRTLEVPLLVRFNPSRKPIVPHLLAGGRFALPLQSEFQQTSYRQGQIIRDDVIEPDFTNIFGYSLGVGITLSLGQLTNLNINLTYNRLDAFYEQNIDLTTTSFILQTGFLF